MLGAFKSTLTAMGGLVWKRRFRLTRTQKYRHRARLREVDDVIAALDQSGVKTAALEENKRIPLESEMTPQNKYWVASKRFRDGIKPVHWVPKWTKTPHPRKWSGSYVHQPKPSP